MVSPFGNSPFGSGSFAQRYEAFQKERTRRLEEQEEQRRNAQLLQAIQNQQQEQQTPNFGNDKTVVETKPQPMVTPQQYDTQPIDYSGFASGVRENAARAGLGVLNFFGTGFNFAEGVAARYISPRETEFDKQLKAVEEERKLAGKPGGVRGYVAAGTEAARRAQPGKRVGQYFAAGVITGLDLPGEVNILGIKGQDLGNKKKEIFKQLTGENWNAINALRFLDEDYEATRRSYLETDQPKYVKGALELVGDPWSVVPGMVLTKDIIAGVNLAKGMVRVGVKTPIALGKQVGNITGIASKQIDDLEEYKQLIDRYADSPSSELFDQIKTKGAELKKSGYDIDDLQIAGTEGRVLENFPGVYNTLIPPARPKTKHITNSLDEAGLLNPKYLDDYWSPENLSARLDETATTVRDEILEQLTKKQSSVVQDSLRAANEKMKQLGLEKLSLAFESIGNVISPAILAKLPKVGDYKNSSVQAELLMARGIHDMLQNMAITSTNMSISSRGGSFKNVFKKQKLADGTEVGADGFILTPNKQDAAAIYKILKSRKGNVDKAVTEGLEANRFLESDVVFAVVDIKQTPDGFRYIFDIKDEFKKAGSDFWDAEKGILTARGDYVTKTAAIYADFAKLLDETGNAIYLEDRILSGAERIKYLLQQNAYSTRFVYNKRQNAEFAGPGLEKFYNKTRKLFDPDEINDEVISKARVKYTNPEDAMQIYASSVYKQISDSIFNANLHKLFINNKELAKELGVVVSSKAYKGKSTLRGKVIQGAQASGRTPKYVLKDKEYTLSKDGTKYTEFATDDGPRKYGQIYDGLLFQDEKLAAKFAKDADIFLGRVTGKDNGFQGLPELGFFNLFKNRLLESKVITVPQNASKIFRLAGTGVDLGLLAIYGPVIFGLANAKLIAGVAQDNQKLINEGKGLMAAIGKATKDSFIITFKPNQQSMIDSTYKIGNREAFNSSSQFGVTYSRRSVEAYEATQPGGVARNFLENATPNINWPERKIKNAIYSGLGRFENAWSTFIDTIKMESWKAMTSHLDLASPEGARTGREIADMLNKMTGTLSSDAVGLSRFQKSIEQSFLFFSPRMTRSMIALLSDSMTRGGTTGSIARQGVLGGWFALQGYTWAVGQALGQEVNLDPSEPHYMQLKIGNDWLGPGSAILSIPRATIRAVAGPNDRAAVYNEIGEDGGFRDNAWFQLLRGRTFTAPAGSMLIDAITNENYFGEPYDGVTDFAGAQTKRFLPFWAQDVVVGDPYRIGPAALVAEFGGLRTRAETIYERRRNIRDQAVQDMFDVATYEELDPINKRLFNSEVEKETSDKISDANFRDYKAIDMAVDDYRLQKGVESTIVDDYFDELRKVKDAKRLKIAEALKTYKTSALQKPSDLRRTINSINAEFGPQFNKIFSETGEYAEAQQYLKRLNLADGVETQEEMWIESFKERVLYNPEWEKTTEQGIEYFDYDGKTEAEKVWTSEFGQEAYDYVQEYLLAGKDTDPILVELTEARDRFSYYWDAPKREAISYVANLLGKQENEVKLTWETYLRGTAIQQEALKELPMIKEINKFINATRSFLREQDMALDGFLYRWGYTTTLRHPDNLNSVGAGSIWNSKSPIDIKDASNLYNQFALKQESVVQ